MVCMACNITPYSFSLSRSGIPRSLNVSDNEMIGVIEFIISWVNTRINFCQASISLRSNTCCRRFDQFFVVDGGDGTGKHAHVLITIGDSYNFHFTEVLCIFF